MRESRLFGSTWTYIRRNVVAIFRIYTSWEPLFVFTSLAGMLLAGVPRTVQSVPLGLDRQRGQHRPSPVDRARRRGVRGRGAGLRARVSSPTWWPLTGSSRSAHSSGSGASSSRSAWAPRTTSRASRCHQRPRTESYTRPGGLAFRAVDWSGTDVARQKCPPRRGAPASPCCCSRQRRAPGRLGADVRHRAAARPEGPGRRVTVTSTSPNDRWPSTPTGRCGSSTEDGTPASPRTEASRSCTTAIPEMLDPPGRTRCRARWRSGATTTAPGRTGRWSPQTPTRPPTDDRATRGPAWLPASVRSGSAATPIAPRSPWSRATSTTWPSRSWIRRPASCPPRPPGPPSSTRHGWRRRRPGLPRRLPRPRHPVPAHPSPLRLGHVDHGLAVQRHAGSIRHHHRRGRAPHRDHHRLRAR